MRVLDMRKYDYVYTDRNTADPVSMNIIGAVKTVIQESHAEMIESGVAPEDARGILPTNIATNVVCKFHLPPFSELFYSPPGSRTQPE